MQAVSTAPALVGVVDSVRTVIGDRRDLVAAMIQIAGYVLVVAGNDQIIANATVNLICTDCRDDGVVPGLAINFVIAIIESP